MAGKNRCNHGGNQTGLPRTRTVVGERIPQGLLVKTSRWLPAEAANIIGRDQVLRRNGQLLRQLINRLTNSVNSAKFSGRLDSHAFNGGGQSTAK